MGSPPRAGRLLLTASTAGAGAGLSGAAAAGAGTGLPTDTSGAAAAADAAAAAGPGFFAASGAFADEVPLDVAAAGPSALSAIDSNSPMLVPSSSALMKAADIVAMFFLCENSREIEKA